MTCWNVRALGSPDSPPVAFLHGFLGSHQDWLPFAPVLAEKFYCLLFDLPGHAESPLDEQPGYESWARSLHQTLNTLTQKPVTLLGYSLGGRLALYYALNYPGHLARLILESASPGISDEAERAKRLAWDQANARLIRDEGMLPFLERWYALPLFSSLTAEQKKTLIARRSAQDPRTMAAVIESLSPGAQPDLWSRLPDLTTPALYLAGALDEKYAAIGKQFAQKTPNCKRTVIPSAGHTIHFEQPGAFLETLSAWLER